MRMIAIIASIALCVLGIIGWLLLPTEIRALFPLSHRLGLLGIFAFPIVAMGILASSYVRANESGLRIRNALRVHRCPGSESTRSFCGRVIHGLNCCSNPLTVNRSRPIWMPTGEQLMGIQTVDGPLATAAVTELRARHRRFREDPN